jgi:hypothetical protein
MATLMQTASVGQITLLLRAIVPAVVRTIAAARTNRIPVARLLSKIVALNGKAPKRAGIVGQFRCT